MVNLDDKIESWGYDEFIGREVFHDGSEAFVTLDLKSFGSTSYRSLEMACDQLCYNVKEGKKVLLVRNPGYVGSKSRKASLISESLNSNVFKLGINARIVDQEPGVDEYIIPGRRYEPFNSEQMTTLQMMYQEKLDMKKFPNPFDNQPLIN